MDELNLYRGKRIDNEEWVEGNRIDDGVTGQVFIHAAGNCTNESDKVQEDGFLRFVAFEVDPETICPCTGRHYMNGELAYAGDRFESQVNGLHMTLYYGFYQAYCPADNAWVDSVGFYAEADGYPQMPIGDLEHYALKIGTIFDEEERELCQYSPSGTCEYQSCVECGWCEKALDAEE